MCIYQDLFISRKQNTGGIFQNTGGLFHPTLVSHSLQMQTTGETGFDHATTPTPCGGVIIVERDCGYTAAFFLFKKKKNKTCRILGGGGPFNMSVEIILSFTSFNGFKD